MLRDQIQSDQISALKAGEKARVEALRFILSQIKNKEIDKKEPLNDEETVAILRKQLKELNESIEAFSKGGRTELANASKVQLDILSIYLPAEISDEELQKEVEGIVAANREMFEKNRNAVIGVSMKQLRSKASPDRIMKVLQSIQ
ncbi:MAG: GatB/YqeY domain-containing protein [Patescibacteria group bacterium]